MSKSRNQERDKWAVFAPFVSVHVLSPAAVLGWVKRSIYQEAVPRRISFFRWMPHLQLPPFLPMTAKANSSHSSAFPPPKDQLSNRVCRISPPSPAPLEKKRAIKHSQDLLLDTSFSGSLLRLERLLALGPKGHDPDSPASAGRHLRAHLPQAGSPSALSPKDFFLCKSCHTNDQCRQDPDCLWSPCAGSHPRQHLKETTSVCGGKWEKPELPLFVFHNI